MKVEKETGGFVTHEDVKTDDHIKFLNEGEEVEKDFKGRKSVKLQLQVELPNGEQKLISLNATSKNNMITFYGDDTKDWVGKEARIEVLSQLIQGERKKVVYLTAPGLDFDGNPLN